jgi:ADP-ribose pyrophosphatase
VSAEDDELIEKQLESHLIYDGRIVHLFLDTVRLPDGQSTQREVIRHIGAVAIVPLDANGQVVMVKQYRHPAGRVLLEIPAGTLHPDEPPDVCAVRELQEETGYKPGRLQKIGGIYTAPGYTSEFIHLYLATDLIPSRLDADEDEFLQVVHLPMAEVLAQIQSGAIADGKTISAVLLVKEILAETKGKRI